LSFIIPQEILSINFDEEDRSVPQTSNRQQVMPMLFHMQNWAEIKVRQKRSKILKSYLKKTSKVIRIDFGGILA
jgi:hypothetical protein